MQATEEKRAALLILDAAGKLAEVAKIFEDSNQKEASRWARARTDELLNLIEVNRADLMSWLEKRKTGG